MPLGGHSPDLPRPFAIWLHRDRFPTVLLLLAVMFATCLMPAQSDTWWQLRTGQEMWRSGRVMLQDEFTHTVAGQRWPNHEWLSQVVFYGVYSLGGMPLLTLLCSLAITTAWAIVAALTPGAPLVRVALLGSGVVMSASGWTLRPQALTMALFAATLWILVRRRGVWMLPLLFLVWANLHGAVALGGVLVIAATVHSLITRDRFLRTLIPVGALCLIATALTPLGTSLWLEIPFSLQRLQPYGVDEWKAPGLTRPADIAFWLMAATVLALAIIRRAPASMLTIATALLFIMAARSGRHIAPFVVCAVPALATLLLAGRQSRGLSDAREPAAQLNLRPTKVVATRVVANASLLAIAVIAAVLYVAYAWWAPLPRLRWHPLPEHVLTAIADCEGPLYNRYDEGGFLIWFLPDRKVFLDSRQDPFPEELVLDHIRMQESGDYQATFSRYGIRCAFIPRPSPLAARLRQDGWEERSKDGVWSVLSAPVGR